MVIAISRQIPIQKNETDIRNKIFTFIGSRRFGKSYSVLKNDEGKSIPQEITTRASIKSLFFKVLSKKRKCNPFINSVLKKNKEIVFKKLGKDGI